MASEVTVTSKLVIKKGSAFATSFPDSITYTADMAGTNMGNSTQNIGTTVEEIALGDINGGGNKLATWWVKNLSATNFVELSWGDATGTNFADRIICQIKPGKTAGPLEAPASRNNLYAKANTAAVDIAWTAHQL